MRTLLAAATAAVLLTATATAGAAPARHCGGRVDLGMGSSATNITARNVSCSEAKVIISEPGRNAGYRCRKTSNVGSGGWWACRNAAKVITFRLNES